MIKRIVACLDIIGKNVVKGKKFKKVKKVGILKKLTKKYYREGADEIVILNINKEKIKFVADLIKSATKEIFVPIIYGGNIKKMKEIKKLFESGIDRICLNTTLFKKPKLVKSIAKKYGRQSLIASIDVKKKGKEWIVYIDGGKTKTNIEVIKWIKRQKKKGIGEVLITSIDKDGKKEGYDIDLIKLINNKINIPIIASGGMGKIKDIEILFNETKADAALIASYLHIKKKPIKLIKKKLLLHNKFNIRI